MILKPSAKDIRRVLSTLSKRDYFTLIRVGMDIRSNAQWLESLSVTQQLRIYVYEWLTHLSFLSETNCRQILQQCNLEIGKYGRWLEQSPYPEIQSPALFTLTVVDRRYVTWSGSSGWFDLHEDTFTQEPLTPKVTFITCNLFDCFRQKQEWLQRLQGGGNAGKHGHQHHADSAGLDSGAGGESSPEGPTDSAK